MKVVVSAMLLATIGLGATGRDVGGQKPNPVAQAPDYWTYGSGTDSCGQWVLNKRAFDSLAFESHAMTDANVKPTVTYQMEVQWVYGYVSATGLIFAGMPQPVGLAETDAAAIKAWMDKYCADHVLDHVSDGVPQLVAELVKRKREKSH